MSNEMTAKEYLDKHQWMMSDQSIVIYVSDLDAYKSLVEKEAIKDFAEELMNLYEKDYRSIIDDRIIVAAVRSEHIKLLAKQKGIVGI